MSNATDLNIGTKDDKDQGKGGGEKPDTGPNVSISINSVLYEIHRGRQTVAAIKTVGKVPLADDLEQVEKGVITKLPDDGAVTIKGGERFISSPKTGASSNH